MKTFLILILTVCLSTANAQNQGDFTKFNHELNRVLLDLSTKFLDCKYKHYTLKIEVNDSQKLDVSVSDSVDSLYRVNLIGKIKKLDTTPFFNYLTSNQLTSAVFLKRLTFSAINSRCPEPAIELSQIQDFMKFNGKEFIGQSIWLEPDFLRMFPLH